MGGADEFSQRLDFLASQVGYGLLRMQAEVDQVYAAPQERGFWETGPNAGVHIRRHPGGGQTHALRDSLIPFADEYMAQLANDAINPDGSELHHNATQVVSEIGRHYTELAPVEWGDLRASVHKQVIEDGVTTFDEGPIVPRLTAEELAHKERGNRGRLE